MGRPPGIRVSRDLTAPDKSKSEGLALTLPFDLSIYGASPPPSSPSASFCVPPPSAGSAPASLRTVAPQASRPCPRRARGASPGGAGAWRCGCANGAGWRGMRAESRTAPGRGHARVDRRRRRREHALRRGRCWRQARRCRSCQPRRLPRPARAARRRRAQARARQSMPGANARHGRPCPRRSCRQARAGRRRRAR